MAEIDPAPPVLEDALPAMQGETRGRLKVFLGYFSGVGKTFRMFDEGRRRKERGQDVVVGIAQRKLSADVEAILDGMEVIAPRLVSGEAAMDLAAILRRRPQVCLVDALAFDNPAGSTHAHRWQDVEELLAAGISVVSAINLQYIGEYRERASRITGKQVTATVPEAFLTGADEIVVVDAPADMANSAPAEQDEARRRLSGLRELALLLTADVVDRQLETYLHRHGIRPFSGAHERILVCVAPQTHATAMIDSGLRHAARFHGELIVANVRQKVMTAVDQQGLERTLAYAKEKGVAVELLEGGDAVAAILAFARQRGVTQIFIGHSLRHDWRSRFAASPVDRLIEAAGGIDVRVFPQ